MRVFSHCALLDTILPFFTPFPSFPTHSDPYQTQLRHSFHQCMNFWWSLTVFFTPYKNFQSHFHFLSTTCSTCSTCVFHFLAHLVCCDRMTKKDGPQENTFPFHSRARYVIWERKNKVYCDVLKYLKWLLMRDTIRWIWRDVDIIIWWIRGYLDEVLIVERLPLCLHNLVHGRSEMVSYPRRVIFRDPIIEFPVVIA